jgi:LysR family transcriptional activator of nhaA
MEWVNYHHLLYFWQVVRKGSLAGASAELRLAQSTVSKQIHLLEDILGHKLFTKSGRRLVLTESGQTVYRYADEIFTIGREMLDTLRGRPIGRPLRLTVGVADVVPKVVTERVLSAVYELPEVFRLVCKEGKPDRLLADLALHELDMVLSDAPASPAVGVRAFNHLLGESEMAFFGRADLAKKYRSRFPASLREAPVLLPTENTASRLALEQWFDAHDIRPNVVGEFEDTALMKVFGLRGAGLFPAPMAITREVEVQYKARLVGQVPEVREQFYVVTLNRKIKHPAIKAITEVAKSQIFARESAEGVESDI